MKKIILLLALFCTMSFGQGWNSTVTITSINEPNLEKMDLFTNASGNHILIKRTNGNIVYYNVNSSGTVDANKTATLETSGDFPNIVGSGEIVYALYKAGSEIHMKYSSNGGTNWTYSYLLDISIGSNLCNGIDAVYEDQLGVHLAWATRDSDPNFETYYYRLTTENSWVEFKNVTDHSGAQVGGNPHVTFSSNRVHVGFNTDYYDATWTPGDAKTRDRNNGTWETPQTVISGAEQSVDEKLIVRGSTLYLFYSKYEGGDPQRNNLNFRTRCVSCTTWSSATELATNIYEAGNAFNLCKTINDDIHTAYDPEEDEETIGLGYTYFNGSGWSNPIILGTDIKQHVNRGISSVSNDVYVTWGNTGDGYLRYRQYDAAPLTPSDFQLTNSGSPYYHPYLSWNAVNEPDVRIKNNGLRIERSIEVNGQWSSWSEIAAISGTSTTYTDGDIINATGGGNGRVKYRIRSYDDGGNFSSYTSEIIIRYGTSMEKEGVLNTSNIVDYTLDQNYPNPFNPSTNITYQIKDRGFVSLKVYDMLGKEIADLVNETQETGEYSVIFNASNLPSGIYIYSLRVNDFVQNSKMTLLK